MSFHYLHDWPISANPGEVFRALTDPAALRQWFAEGAQVEPRAGGVYRFWGRHTPGTPPQDAARQVITRFDPDATLAYDWPIDEVETSVTLRLATVPAGTRLTLTHDLPNLTGRDQLKETVATFWKRAIPNLVAYLNGTEVTRPDYFASEKP